MSLDNPIILRRISQVSANKFLLVSGLIALWSFLLWLLPNWDYLPDWAPVPGPKVMNDLECLKPIIMCVLGLPTLAIFVLAFISNTVNLFVCIVKRRLNHLVVFLLGVTILGTASLPWWFAGEINRVLIDYGISRYDPVIDAIENYRRDNGYYPPTLEVLVPQYLPQQPSIYMKYGEKLIYSTAPPAWYDHAPFAFELYGHINGIHGQTLKYCPIESAPCSTSDRKTHPGRINQRWIWVLSSAL